MPVLYIKDQNGNFVSIPSIQGANGKSAYQQAVDGGFMGTEDEFIAILNGILNGAIPASLEPSHIDDISNPHKVTAEQAGALPTTGGVMTGAVQWNEGKTGIVGQGDGNLVFRNYKLTESGNDDVLAFQNTEVRQNMLRMYRNGVPYSIYGQHNKPSPADIGAISSTIEESDRVQRICTGNHNYIHNKFDADVPEMPVVSNFTHYVTLDANNKVYAVLSIPVDYTNKAFYYTAQDKLWHEITSDGAKMHCDHYVGVNSAPSTATREMSFTCNFVPKMVIVQALSDYSVTAKEAYRTAVFFYGVPFGILLGIYNNSSSSSTEFGTPIPATWEGSTLKWKSTKTNWCNLDAKDVGYDIIAFG